MSGDLSGQKSDSEGSQYDINMGSDIQLPSPAQSPRIDFGCFQIWAIMAKAAINTACRFLCGHTFSTPLDKYQQA